MMLGAIIGDVVGSRYEWHNLKDKQFLLFSSVCRFTDDSVCTVAVTKALLDNLPIDYSNNGLEKLKEDVRDSLVEFVHKYDNYGYGGHFYAWAMDDEKHEPYYSYGNGSAMRVSACGYIGNSIAEVLKLAKATAEVSHNHPEGIKGAQAIAVCVYLARTKHTKEEIKEYIYNNFYPELEYLDYDELVKNYVFDVSCAGSVPEAIYCFLISEDFEDCIRTAISIGGDSDTIGCMAGAIAEAYYKDTDSYKEVVDAFNKKNYIPQEFIDILSKI